jgi:outer membrane protein assembly factor BamB
MGKDKSNITLWKRIAQVAGIFAFIISMLLIVNYAQYKRIDPVETELINSLVDRLNDNPDDVQLREQIRTIDLLARKAYFTNQWQIRTGGYLLLLTISILMIAMQMIKSNSPKNVVIGDDGNSFLEQKNARKWISAGGLILVFAAFTVAFLTHYELSENFSNAIEVTQETESSQKEKILEEENLSLKEETKQNEIIEIKIVEKPIVEKKKNATLNVKDKAKMPEDNSNKVAETVKQITKSVKKNTESKNETTLVTEELLSDFPSQEEILNNHPAFRGINGIGISLRKNIPENWDAVSGENIVWELEIPLHGYNSPIIWEDKIFISGANSAKREVYCIDRKSGKLLWTGEAKNIHGSPATAPEVTEDTGQAAPSLTTDGRRVYAIFANGDIIAFNMEGEQVWARNLGSPGNHYGHSSSLILHQNILIVQYDIKKSPRLMGLNILSGETVWETSRKVKVSWASPILVNTENKTEIILVADPIVASYDPLTGKENWNLNCIFGEVGPSAGYADGVVYAVNEYAILVAIKLGEKPEVLWESDEYLSDVPSPVATSELMFMATSYGVVLCYDAKTGEILWEHEYDNGFYSSPMLVDGKIYLIDMKGIMHIFKAEREFVSIADCPLGEDCMTTAAFTDGKIYIRGNKNLFCIGK